MLRFRILAIACGVALLANSTVWALYIQPQLANTPVERLVANLEAKLKDKPDDFETRHNLARLYAMAYAKKSDELQTIADRKSGEQNVWFGYEPRPVPFRNVETKDAGAKMKAAANLAKAIEQYEKLLKAEPENNKVRLGYGWTLKEAGKDMQAAEAFRKVIKDAWPKEKDMRSAGLGWYSLTKEAYGYLTPMLDAENDKAELAELKEKIASMNRVARPITPIAIPLKSGLDLNAISAPNAAVTFDADGSGKAQAWSWIQPEAGWLVYDQQQTGKVDSALQLFGNVSFWCFWENGYHALASLDDNLDGSLRDDELQHLAIWCDANSNGISEPGEVKPLADFGIVALSCKSKAIAGRLDLVSPAGVLFANGEKRDSYDVILRLAK